VGVVENGLVVPEPPPLAKPMNADFVTDGIAVDAVPPRELVEPNVDPPLVTPNLNLGAVAAAPDVSVVDGVEVFEGLKPNADSAGFGDSVLAVGVEEVPRAVLGAELAGLLENPKLNLGVVVAAAVADDVFCGVLVLPKIGVDFAGALVALAGSFAVLNEPKTDVGFAGSLAALDEPNIDVGLAVSAVEPNEPKTDVGFVGSAEDLSVFPKIYCDPLSTGANDCGAPVLGGANPPRRPNNGLDPLPSEVWTGLAGSAFFESAGTSPKTDGGALLAWLLNKKGDDVDVFDPPGVEAGPLTGALNPNTGALGAALGCVG